MKKGLRVYKVPVNPYSSPLVGRIDLMKKGLRVDSLLLVEFQNLVGRIDLMKKGLRVELNHPSSLPPLLVGRIDLMKKGLRVLKFLDLVAKVKQLEGLT